MKKENIRRFFKVLNTRFWGSELNITSVLIAYYALLAIFPLVIALGTILPFLNIDPASAISYAEVIIPPAVRPVLEPIIQSLLTVRRGGWLSLSIVGLLWSASRGTIHLQTGLNKAYGLYAQDSYLARRTMAVIMMMLLITVAAVFVALLNFGDMAVTALAPVFPQLQSFSALLSSLKWPIAIPFAFCCLTAVYIVAPDVRVRPLRALPGSVFATAGLLLLVQLFSLYIRFIANSLNAYGALSAVFVLMFWLNFSAYIVMLGGILNATVNEYMNGGPAAREKGLDKIITEKILPKVPRRKKKRAESADHDSTKPSEPKNSG